MYLGEDEDNSFAAVPPVVDKPRSAIARRPRSPTPPPQLSWQQQQQQANNRYEEDSEANDPHEGQQQHFDRSQLLNQAAGGNNEVFFDDSMKPKEKWIPYCPRLTDPEDLDRYETEEVKDTDWCFLCYFSESVHRHEDYAVIAQFIRYLRENWEKVSPAVLTAQGQLWYRERIQKLWPHLPMLPRKQIIYHFILHQPDDFIMDIQELRTLNHASFLISQNELYEYEETSKDVRINPKAQTKYLGIRRRMDVVRERVNTKKTRHHY